MILSFICIRLLGLEVSSRSFPFVVIQRCLSNVTEKGWSVTSISGAMDYQDRDRVIDEFRKNVTNILVSTDVLSRGFDVSDVS